jgi:hypothetical protein
VPVQRVGFGNAAAGLRIWGGRETKIWKGRGFGTDLMIGDADGSRCPFGLSGYPGVGSGMSIEFQAVARFQGSMERPDCKLMFHRIL